MKTVIRFFIALLIASSQATAIVFVKAGATGANNGASWADAFTNLQTAIAAPGVTEIWVGAGTYMPAVSTSFAMRTGLAVYGGFQGSETKRAQRDASLHITTLNGGGITRVVTANAVDTTAVLDGFTVTGGYHAASGGGLLITDSTLTLRNCIITANESVLGAGMNCSDSTLTIEDCRFENNVATEGRGGAIFATGNTADAVLHPLILWRCTFNSNTAAGSNSAGGALYAADDVPVIAEDCAFVGNESKFRFAFGSVAASGGAAITTADGCKFTRCLFRGNRSHVGGALWLAGNSILANCAFTGNSVAVVSISGTNYGGYGGAIYCYTANVTISGCTLHANSAYSTGGVSIATLAGTSATIVNSILWSNTQTATQNKPFSPQIGGGGSFTLRHSCVRDLLTQIPGEDPPDPAKYPGCIVIDPLFVSERGADNIAGNADDNMQLRSTSPCVDAGRNADIPAGSTLDLIGTSRRHDIVAKADTGVGFAPITDMGAYELAPCFVATLAPASPGTMQLAWSPLGAGWNYTVEWTSDLVAGNWQPLSPAAQWPVLGTSTSIDSTGFGPRAFFRVRPGLISP